MFLFLLACAPTFPPIARPNTTEHETWLIAVPDEFEDLDNDAPEREFIYEDIVELPADTLSATLYARTTLDGPLCKTSLLLGARSLDENAASEGEQAWTGQGRFALHHPLPASMLHGAMELYVGLSPDEPGCTPGFQVDGLSLVITRGARR